MTSYSFLPLHAEFVDNSWRALDRCVYRYVISQGGSHLLAELAAHCSQADGLGHTALALADTLDQAAVRPLRDGERAALCDEALVGDGTRPTAFVVHDGHFYLWRNFANERAVATALAGRIGTTTAFGPVDPDLLAVLFADSTPDQVAQQRLAVARVVQHRLLVLTGAPGTGKTTTVLRMLLALRASARGDELAISIAAPTGKAAQRLAQSLREGAMQLRKTAGSAVLSLLDALPAFDASTLHRLLGYQATTQSWRSGKHRPLDADVVIVDEASMVDLNLLRMLLQSLRADTTLILVGDPDQLASIDSGATLGDIVTGLNTLAHSQWVSLEHVFRASSDLQTLLDAVRIGDHDAFTRTFAEAAGVFSRHRVDDAATLQRQVARWAGALATRLHPALATVGTPESAATALQLLAQRQLLCALRDGPYGAHALAQAIEQRLRIEFNVPIHAAWFAGRSVIIGENDYTHGLFNGDIGIALADADGTLRVWFAATDEHGVASMRALLPDLLPPHEGAGAITIHKAQGSEYTHIGVVLPPDADSRVLSRQLLYTALSRARSSIELWGDESVIASALQHAVRRVGGLAEALVTAVHAVSASASD